MASVTFLILCNTRAPLNKIETLTHKWCPVHFFRHVSRLYARIQQRKGHAKAVGAVARHLVEASYWILTKREPYREPAARPASSTEGPARDTP